MPNKVGRWGPSVLNGFVFHVRGFGCIQNEVLSTYGKSAQSTQKVYNHPVSYLRHNGFRLDKKPFACTSHYICKTLQ